MLRSPKNAAVCKPLNADIKKDTQCTRCIRRIAAPITSRSSGEKVLTIFKPRHVEVALYIISMVRGFVDCCD